MNKEEFISDRLPIFRKVYPEKTDENITEILTKAYDKFSDVIKEL